MQYAENLDAIGALSIENQMFGKAANLKYSQAGQTIVLYLIARTCQGFAKRKSQVCSAAVKNLAAASAL